MSSKIKPGDTVRILHDDASEAPVKAGQCGYVTNVVQTREGKDVITARVGGRSWMFVDSDLAVVDVADAFSESISDLGAFEQDLRDIAALYDTPAPVEGIPVEPAPVIPEPDDEEDEEDEEDEDSCYAGDDDDDCTNCPDAAHYHGENGEPITLPYAQFVDADGDKVAATDVSTLTKEGDSGIVAVIRVAAPRLGGLHLETHLTAEQAIALGEFLISQFSEDTQ